MRSVQGMTQKTGEQVMIAKPLLLAIDRHEEQVCTLQNADHCQTVGATGNRVTQRGIKLIEDAGLHQKQATVLILAGKDILGKVLGQLQIGTGKRGDKGGVIVAILE
ncbi:hypothetical protein D3C78_1496440 [compost metagenome]